MEHAAPTDDAGDWEVVQKEDATSEASPRPTPELSAEAEAPPAATGAPSRNPQVRWEGWEMALPCRRGRGRRRSGGGIQGAGGSAKISAVATAAVGS